MGKNWMHVKREVGQTLILFMVALPLFFALMALVVDGGNILVHRRNVQVAADAAALAIAQSVDLAAHTCATDDTCAGQGRIFAEKNGVQVSTTNPSWHRCNDPDPAHPSDTNCWAYPYVDTAIVSHNDQVEVRLRVPVATFFVGVADALLHGSTATSFDVTARAVASTKAIFVVNPPTTSTDIVAGSTSIQTNTVTVGGGAAILFARCGLPGVGVDQGCKSSAPCTALHISGSNNVFNGAIWSNGGVQDSGRNYGSPSQTPPGNAQLYYSTAYGAVGTSCVVTNSSWWADVQRKDPIDWPVPLPTLTCSDRSTGTTCPDGTHATQVNGVPCNYVGDKYTVTTVLSPGLYCADTKIVVNKAGLTITNVGYIAPEIGWSSGTNILKGYTGIYSQFGGLIFDAYGSNGLNQSGSNNAFTGAIFAANGNAQISGGGQAAACGSTGSVVAACGFIEGATVQLSGSDGSWQGLGGPSVGGTESTQTVTIITPGTTNITTIPGSTSTSGTTLALNQ